MIKICYVNVDMAKNSATFAFPNINSNMIKHILTVKSYVFTTWNNSSEMINYLEVVDSNRTSGMTTIKSKYGIGFVPILCKHLNGLGFMLLNQNKTPFNLYENCQEVRFPILKYQLRNYQYDCSLKWDRDKLGVIKSPTGSGKSVMGCYIIKRSGFKTLILVHTVDLINMWEDSLIKAFGNTFKNKIGIFGSGKSLEKALDYTNNVVIGTYQSATKESNLNQIKRAGFGLIVNDECIPSDSIIHTNHLALPLRFILEMKKKKIDVKIHCCDIKEGNLIEADFDIFKTGIKKVYTVHLEDCTGEKRRINSTLEHKFLTLNSKALKYEYLELEYCDNIVFKDKDWFHIYGVTNLEYRSTEQCYNITVHNENHNYILNGFVSKNCHHVPANTFKNVLNGLMIPYKLGLSATPRRLDGREGDIYALVDNVKASVSIHELIKNGFVVKPEFYNISWTNNDIVRKIANSDKNGLQKSQDLKKMSSTSHIKLTKLVKLLKTFEYNEETFLLFSDFVFAAKAIESIIQNFVASENKSFVIKRVSQDMKSEERSQIFKQVGKKYRGLIFAKLGSEGIDIAAVDNIIIMNPSKSPTTFAQRTGRAMRIAPGKTKCKVFQFVLKDSSEESWSEYSFDEYQNEGFIQKNCIIK